MWIAKLCHKFDLFEYISVSWYQSAVILPLNRCKASCVWFWSTIIHYVIQKCSTAKKNSFHVFVCFILEYFDLLYCRSSRCYYIVVWSCVHTLVLMINYDVQKKKNTMFFCFSNQPFIRLSCDRKIRWQDPWKKSTRNEKNETKARTYLRWFKAAAALLQFFFAIVLLLLIGIKTVFIQIAIHLLHSHVTLVWLSLFLGLTNMALFVWWKQTG